MNDTTFGPEVELLLIGENGDIVSKAKDVVESSDNLNVYPEFVQMLVEIGSIHGSSLHHVVRDLRRNYDDCVAAAAQHRVVPIPLSTSVERDFTTGFTSKVPSERIRMMRSILAGDTDHGAHYFGTHCHIDAAADPAIELRQIQMVTALDILTTLTASSPFLDGEFRGNDPRLSLQRFCHTPSVRYTKELQPYPISLDSYRRFLDNLLDEMVAEAARRGYSGDPPIAADISRNILGPVRRRYGEKKNTIEHRAPGAAPLSYVAAYLVATKAMTVVAEDKNVAFRFDDNPDVVYKIIDGKVMLPTFDLLKNIEAAKMQQGVANPVVHGCLSNLLETVKEYAVPDEMVFLSRFEEIVDTRSNLSDRVYEETKLRCMLDGHRLKPGAAKDVRLLFAEIARQDSSTFAKCVERPSPEPKPFYDSHASQNPCVPIPSRPSTRPRPAG